MPALLLVQVDQYTLQSLSNIVVWLDGAVACLTIGVKNILKRDVHHDLVMTY
jgi:hypothetical protein